MSARLSMGPFARGVVIALVQVLIVSAVGGKLLYDRQVLPRAWARTTGVDPVLPIRGRYVTLNLLVETDPGAPPPGEAEPWSVERAVLSVRDGALHAAIVPQPEDGAFDFDLGGHLQEVMPLPAAGDTAWVLAQPIAFFLPEDAPDPTRVAADEELWAEVTVPEAGPPRPLRLEVRRRQAPPPPPSAEDPLPLVEPPGQPGEQQPQ